MNPNSATGMVSAAANEELVIENLGHQTSETLQPGTCICWVDRSSTR